MIESGATILIATRNRGKTKEFRAAFEKIGVRVTDLNETAGMPEVAETGATFADNALLKAKEIALAAGCPVLADDSGLCVDALGGAPGVYSARYAGEPSSDAANNAKLLRELSALRRFLPDAPVGGDEELSGDQPEDVEPETLSAARFVCALALFDPADGSKWAVEGTVEGRILADPRGEGGFGYDPLFWVPAFGRSMAELSSEEKNAISHRGQATRHLLELLS